METLAFIGSDKNAGKTTVFNFVYQKMHAADTMVCLTSIGINGEPVDTYEAQDHRLQRQFFYHRW